MKRYWLTSLIVLSSIIFMNSHNMFFIFALTICLSIIVDYSALRPLARPKFVLFLVILMFGVPLFIGGRKAHFYGIPYSEDILLMSINMGLRSIIILTAIKILTNHISVEQMGEWLRRMRLKHFSEVFATSMKLMPRVKEISFETFSEFRRSPARLNLFTHVFNWTAKLIARLLFFIEETNYEQE